jgi:WD40 repeat protein
MAEWSAEGFVDPWRVGARIAGTYEVREILGRGGMGVVHRVAHLGWNTDLAVKSPLPELVRRDADRANFTREAETWVALGLHPHVCACHYVRVLDGIPRVFAEYLDAGSVHEWIGDGRLYRGTAEESMARILDIAIQSAWGLAHAHERGVVHQDVKPSNVLLDSEGNAKITDFGLARAQPSTAGRPLPGPDGVTVQVTTGGMTPAYASPEQYERAALGRRSDVWSFAAGVLEMVTGEMTWYVGPAAGAALAAIRSEGGPAPASGLEMPGALGDLLARCLRDEPIERPDMTEVATWLVELYEAEIGRPYPRPAPQLTGMRADELNNRALSLLDLGRGDEAEALFQDARTADPRHPEAIYNFGLLRWRAGTITDEALVHELEGVLGDGTGSARAAGHLLARVHLERGDAEAARSLIEADAAQPPGVEDLRQEVSDAVREAGEAATITITHSDILSWACLTSDGRRILSTGDDHTVGVWDLSDGRCVRTLTGHTDTVNSVCVTPDGQRAVSAGMDGTARVWNLADGRCLHTFRGHTSRGPGVPNSDSVHSVCVTPDGRRVLTAGAGPEVRLWDLSTGRLLRTLRRGSDTGRHTPIHFAHIVAGFHVVTVTPDGRYALSCRADTIQMWELSTGRRLQTFTGHTNTVMSVCVTPDGKRVLSAGSDTTVRVWDLSSGRRLQTLTGHADHVMSVSVSPDCRFAVSEGADATIRLWELSSGRCLRTFTDHAHPRGVSLVRVTPDGRHILAASAHGAGTVQLWKLLPGRHGTYQICRPRGHAELARLNSRVSELVDQAEQAMAKARFPVALGLLRTAREQAGHERAPRVMDAWRRLSTHCPRVGIRTARLTMTLTGHTAEVDTVCVTPDGHHALSVGMDATVRVWDLSTGECVRAIEVGMDSVTSVCVTPDGRHALSASGDRIIRVWELSSGRCVQTLTGHTGYPQSVCVTPDGRQVVSAGHDESIRVWDLSTGRCLRTITGAHSMGVESVSVTPDGRYILSGGQDKTLRVWKSSSGRCVQALMGHSSLIYGVCATSDGRRALSAAPDGVRMWDLSSGRCLHTISTDGSDYTTSVCETPDGKFAVSGGATGTIRVWDLSSGDCLRTLTGHTGFVASVHVTPDGRYAVSGGTDRTVRIWELDWELDADQDERTQPRSTEPAGGRRGGLRLWRRR